LKKTDFVIYYNHDRVWVII